MRMYVVATVLVSAAALGCGGQQPPPGGAMQGMPPTAVQIADARTVDVPDTSEYVGTLKSLQSTSVQSQTEGQITKIYVKSGDRVKVGAPIVEIDARRQRAAVSSQEATRASKQAAANYARQQLQRATQLYAAGAIAKQDLDQAQNAVDVAEADLKSLDAQVQQQQEQLGYFTVTAPTAGVIGDVPVRVGFQITTSTMLTTIDANDTLELDVNVPVERTASLRLGLPLELLDADGQKTVARASINFIAGRVDDTTQSVLVKGTVRNDSGALRASQFVRTRVIWKTTAGVVVPVTAVLRINGQYFVFVAETTGGKTVARQRPITVGPIVGNDYAVLSGVAAGDHLIVSGVQKLMDGAPVMAAPQR